MLTHTKQIVTIKREWLNENEDENKKYVVVEDNGDRLYITPLHTTLSIPPQELVRRHMLNFEEEA